MYSQKMVLNQENVTILALFWVMRLFYLSRIAKNDPNGCDLRSFYGTEGVRSTTVAVSYDVARPKDREGVSFILESRHSVSPTDNAARVFSSENLYLKS